MNEKEVLKHLKESNLDIQSANAAILAADLVYRSYASSDELHGVKFSPVFAHFCYNSPSPFHQILMKDSIVEINEKIYEEYKDDKESFDKKIDEHQKLTDEIDLIWKDYEVSREKNLLNKEIVASFYNKIERVIEKWWHYGVIGEDKGAIIERTIIPALSKRRSVSVDEAQELLSVLSHPEEQAIFNLERKDLLEICLEILEQNLADKIEKNDLSFLEKNNNLKEKIDLYLDHYFWVKTDFYKAKKLTPMSVLKDALNEIGEKSKNEIKNEIIRIDDNFQEIEKQKKELIKKNELTKEDKDDIYFSMRTIYWMDQRKLGMMKHFYYFFVMLEDISNFLEIDYDDLALYTLSELEKLLKEDIQVKNNILIERRSNSFVLLEKGMPTQFFHGEAGREMFEIATSVEKEEVRGVVASKGNGSRELIEGRISVVLDPRSKKFKEGDILVTSMTRVEFVPLMRKAKAIITNEGGLACHAAIVSRELGIPAIIGTKNATHILKDGDIVSVDILKGLITKK